MWKATLAKFSIVFPTTMQKQIWWLRELSILQHKKTHVNRQNAAERHQEKHGKHSHDKENLFVLRK